MSILSRIFGGGGDGGGKAAEPVAYEGLLIRAAPQRAGDRWQLAGVIVKQTDAGELERTFLRADTFTSREEAEDIAIRKGKQIIDEQGARLFADGEPTGRA